MPAFPLRSVAAALALLAGVASATPEACDECPGRMWYVNAKSPASGQNGKSWAGAFRNLNQALSAASPGDCIWVARGRYLTTNGLDRSKAFVIDKRLRLYGGFDGTETCFSQRAGLFKQTRLSGEIGQPGPADNAYQVINVSGPTLPGEKLEVVIDGFNIRDANNEWSLREGGGIQMVFVAKALIANCTIRNNRADDGGGLHVRGSDVDIVRTSFINNRARRDGGGLYLRNVGSGYASNIGGTLYNVELRNNHAERHGGGFYVSDMPGARQVEFVNALIDGNTAKSGGAGYLPEPTGGLLGTLNPGIARLVNSTVVGNFASNWGGAFAVEEQGPLPAELWMDGCIVWNNTGGFSVIGATPGFSILDYTLVQLGSIWACTAACGPLGGCNVFACDPQFTAGFQLGPGSPARDVGTPLQPPDRADLDGDGDMLEPVPLDFADAPRFVGPVDLGCFEAP